MVRNLFIFWLLALSCAYGRWPDDGDATLVCQESLGTPPLRLPLSSSPFASTRGRSLVRKFGASLGLDPAAAGSHRIYRDQAREFAAGEWRGCLVRTNADGTMIKMELPTGRLIVVSSEGEIAAFLRLPLRLLERRFGSARDVFAAITGNISQAHGPQSVRAGRLSADVPLRAFAFLPSIRQSHFEKHVVERGEFDFPTAEEYERAAVAFATDRTRAAICVTEPARHGVASLRTVKLDPITDEVVVVDRFSGRIITYYRASLDHANEELGRSGPVANLFEYLLLATDFALPPP